ncbi:MAG: uroporphyrinogen-III synthase [Gammaproteobacteria bacterium]|nr:uroporphyrinogen-III synthase [Gammaproteobacteria bacterium]MBP9729399.1 uroporphyrinogen-III synthase [Gammaproteobacteria bacterium]
MNILITRPQALASRLCQKIQDLGHRPACIPMIEIQPAPHYTLAEGLELFKRINIALFTSQAAVHYATPLIQAQPSLWPSITYMAIGPGTQQALQALGIPTVLIPEAPPYETESLLKLKNLQSILGTSIAIVKGEGGRTLLAETLKARGALVYPLVVYLRCMPSYNTETILENWDQHLPDLSVSTSASALEHLIALFPPTALHYLQKHPIVVVGSRMLALAHQRGFQKPVLATGADDSAIVSAIIKVLRTYEDRCP